MHMPQTPTRAYALDPNLSLAIGVQAAIAYVLDPNLRAPDADTHCPGPKFAFRGPNFHALDPNTNALDPNA